jgi:2',3'-cyclic-nucleotide 2'-phosphodiesterase/3'-nucleotidase/5'-nucleotidase
MGTTDVHGWLLPYDYYTGEQTDHGLALLLPLIDSVRAANTGATVLVDSGDLLQGNALNFVHAELIPGTAHPVARAMNLAGYDAAAIGNHEFNYGIEHLNRVIRQATFPFLSANIFHAGSSEHAYQPYTILERQLSGRVVKIGMSAVTPPGVLLWDRDNVEGRLDFRDVVASVRPLVARMRDEGADVVVIASHGGLEGSSYDPEVTGVPGENAAAAIAREIEAVDVIFMGHTHRELADSVIGSTLLVQARNWAGSLAVAELGLTWTEADGWRVTDKRGEILRPQRGVVDEVLARELAGAHERTQAYVARPIGSSPVAWSAAAARIEDTPILDLINVVQQRATGADLSSTAAFSTAARIPRGPVTVADIAGLYIYDNTLKAIRISGAQLRAYLEKSAEYYLHCPGGACESFVNPDVPGYNFDVISGVDYTLDVSRPFGERVVRLEHEGAPVHPSDSFTLALNNYRASGAGGFSMLAGAPVVYDRGEGIRELIIAEIERQGSLKPADYFDQNWEIVPEALRERVRAEAPVPSTRKRLRVIGTNDFHGALQPSTPGFAGGREVGGAATLAAYVSRAREGAVGPTVLIDAGDIMQGTPISNLSDGRATVDFFNAVGYAAAALGNHEFDWGIDLLRQRVAQARFPWLGANIFVAGSDTLPAWVEPTTMVTLPGCEAGAPACDSVKVGIVGIANSGTPQLVRPSFVAALEFGDEAEAIERWVPRLREAGADFVIVTVHEGAYCEQVDQPSSCEGPIIDAARGLTVRPDLIVSGHSHSHLNLVVNGIRIVQANSSGTRLSIVDLERVSPDSVEVSVAQPTTFGSEVTPDPLVAALVARYEEEIGPRVNEVISMLCQPLTREGHEFALGNLIADAQRTATGTQIALMNNGGIRTELLAGPVRYGDLYRLQPFSNTLVTMELTGAQLVDAIEQGLTRDGYPDTHVSGIRVWLDPDAARGSRVREVELSDGTPVSPGGRYTVTVNVFMAEGGDRYTALTEGTDRMDTGIVDLEALVEYLEGQPTPLPVPDVARFEIVR